MKRLSSVILIITMLFVSFGAYASTPNETMAFLDAVNNTWSVSAMKALVDSNADITKNFDGIYYTDAIYAGLIGRNFTSVKEINELIASLTEVEITSPKVEIKVDGNKASSVGNGVNTVTVAPTLKDGFKLAAATYRDGSLGGADIKDASKTSSVELSLGKQNGTEDSKVMFIKDMKTLTPMNAYDVFYDDAVNIYVSPNGKNTGDGTKENPFGSIEEARDYVRTLIPTMQSDIRVNIASGTYYITEPIEFTEADGGKNGFDVIYTGNFGENLPLISGGKPVTNWNKAGDSNIYKAHVDGVTEARQFYIDGFSAERAKSKEYFIAEKKYIPINIAENAKEFTFEFEDAPTAPSTHKYYDASAGEYLLGSAGTSTDPSFTCTFEVAETGYYIPKYIVGRYTLNSYPKITIKIDDTFIGDNVGDGIHLTQYEYKMHSNTSNLQTHEYTKGSVLLNKGTHTLSVEVTKGEETYYNYKMDKISFVPNTNPNAQDKTEEIYSDTDIKGFRYELEDSSTAPSNHKYFDASAGEYLLGSAGTSTNPSFTCTFEVPETGYYIPNYIMGKYSVNSYAKITIKIDGTVIGNNDGDGTHLTQYANKMHSSSSNLPTYEYTGSSLFLKKGTHTMSVEVKKGRETYYHYKMDKISFVPEKVRDGFYLSGYDLPEFSNSEDLELLSPILWSFHRLPVKDVRKLPDEDRHVFVMDQPYYLSYYNMVSDGGQQPTEGIWFYIENAFEYLDEPGEFWFDKENSDIYYYPRTQDELTKDAYIPVSEGLIKINGSSPESKISNLTIANLDFRHGAYNELSVTGNVDFQADCMMVYDKIGVQPSGIGVMPLRQIDINYADNITIENCRLSNLGSAAIGMVRGVTNSTVRKNEINDISGTSIIVGTWNYTETSNQNELSSDITIENNYIRRVGQELLGSPGMGVYYAKNVNILHNDIEDTPYSGITMGWGWGTTTPVTLGCGGHSIVRNRFNKTSRLMRDGAAIYTNGSFPESGVVISDNYITDSPDFAGIYMDSGACCITIENNVIDNVVDGVEYNWGRGTARNGAVKNNYVVIDKNALGTTSSEVSGTVEVSDRNWPQKAQEIITSAGLNEEIRGIIESDARPQSFVAPYDYLTPVESTRSTDILIEGENYKSYYNVEPIIYTRGKYRKLVASFNEDGWYRYNITVPQSGKYRVELRCRIGGGNDTSVAVGGVTVRILSGTPFLREQASLKEIPLNATATSSDAQPSVRLGELDLTQGSYTLEIKNTKAWWTFDNIKLIYVGE